MMVVIGSRKKTFLLMALLGARSFHRFVNFHNGGGGSSSSSNDQPNIGNIKPNSSSSSASSSSSSGIQLICEDGDDIPLKAPSFIVIGAMKSGTTATEKIFKTLPNVIPTIKGENHFFTMSRVRTWARRGRLPSSSENRSSSTPFLQLSDKEACRVRREYMRTSYDLPRLRETVRKFTNTTTPKQVLAFDRTPDYIRIPGVASAVHRIFENVNPRKKDNSSSDDSDYRSNHAVKIVVLLRDPVTRLQSDYLMRTIGRRFKNVPESLEGYISRQLKELKKANFSKAVSFSEYQQQYRRGDEVKGSSFALWGDRSFPQRMKYVSERKFKYMNSLYIGMYAQQLWEWLQHFELGKELLVIQYEKLRKEPHKVYPEIMEFVGASLSELPSQDVFESRYGIVHDHVKEPERYLNNETESYLRHFYKPYNEELAELLGEEWRGVWDDS